MKTRLQRIILANHLIIAVLAMLVCLYIWLFEGFIEGKAYMQLPIALLFGWLYYRNRNR
jgi:hypothetical protein